MKRDLADITKRLFRRTKKSLCEIVDLSDSIYFIYSVNGSLTTNILREIENFDAKPQLRVSINTQTITNDHYVVESDSNKVYIKFIKEKLSYTLGEEDVVEVIGQLN